MSEIPPANRTCAGHAKIDEFEPKATSAESLAAGMIPLTTGLD